LADGVDGVVPDGAAGAGGRDFQRVGLVVGGQHHAVAVQNLAPVGNNRNNGRAVALSLLREVFVPEHLEVRQARCQQAKGHDDHHRDDQYAQPESRQVGLDVAQFGHGG
jgi:hypothetical protein